MQINTNISSLVTRNFLNKSSSSLENTMEKLSSGKRINSASDDAAGLAISTRMTSQIRGKGVAIRNAQDGLSMLQTAESAMGSVTNIMQRMRELAVQADNGTNSNEDRLALQNEFTQLRSEIDEIAGKTTFNGLNLLDGTNGAVNLHIGDGATDTTTINFTNIQTSNLGIDSNADGLFDTTNDDIDTNGFTDTLDNARLADFDADGDGAVDDEAGAAANGAEVGNAQHAIKIIDASLDTISSERSKLGAYMNRLEFTVDNLTTSKTNTADARSRILDADMAEASSELTKSKILSQSSIAMLSQANQNPQMVLQLLG